MVASNALMGNAVRPFGLLVGVWSQALETRTAWRRLDALLQEPKPRGEYSGELKGQVSVKALTAKVEGREKPILDAIDAEFKAGEMVALVGPSGAGKSTFVRCLLGAWPDYRGQVLLDGRSERELSREAIGQQIGYLPQDIELFDGTIAQNISRFKMLNNPAVVPAAQLAGVHDMILGLPKGYDTVIGEGGVALSGGQRQRIALARALLGSPRLVFLDEPNASLDDAGEVALQAALTALRERGVTVFMVVHRQHYLKLADRVLVLQDGKIASQVSAQPARNSSVNLNISETAR
jgi:ATP-binding cassette subfamily C exporter for protease/lipase